MDIKYNAILTLIPVFADKNYPQTHPNYFKILVDKDGKVLSKNISGLHKTIEICLEELYNEYIKVDYSWPLKELVDCRKINSTIEIIYLCRMPFLRECNKSGKMININEFFSSQTDEYYGEIISSASPRAIG